MIETLNTAGWEPVTYATSSHPHVYVERFGSDETFYLTLRNTTDYVINTDVALDVQSMGLPLSASSFAISELITGSAMASSVQGNRLVVPTQVPAKSTRILKLEASAGDLRAVDLVSGWNLVSIPGVPVARDASVLFAALSGNLVRVYAFDASTQEWLRYDPNQPFGNTLGEIEAWQALWINVTNSTTWSVPCADTSAIGVPLQPGWNLVGYPFQTAQSIAAATTSLGSSLDVVFSYDVGAEQVWRVYSPAVPEGLNSLTVLTPGSGYWLRANAGADWLVSGS